MLNYNYGTEKYPSLLIFPIFIIGKSQNIDKITSILYHLQHTLLDGILIR